MAINARCKETMHGNHQIQGYTKTRQPLIVCTKFDHETQFPDTKCGLTTYTIDARCYAQHVFCTAYTSRDSLNTLHHVILHMECALCLPDCQLRGCKIHHVHFAHRTPWIFDIHLCTLHIVYP